MRTGAERPTKSSVEGVIRWAVGGSNRPTSSFVTCGSSVRVPGGMRSIATRCWHCAVPSITGPSIRCLRVINSGYGKRKNHRMLAQQRSMTMAHSALNYDPTRRYDFKVEDVEYRRDSDQSWLAMVYQPQGRGPFPALLDIHGGAWNNGDRTNNPAIAEGLAASGVVVVSIDFPRGGHV